MTGVRVPFLVAAACLMAACSATGATAEVSVDRLKEMVQVLTAPALAGRGSGSDAALAAADTLAVRMERWGLEPAFAGSWFQEVPLAGEGWAGQDLDGRTGRNVGGILPGRGDLADRYLVIGAHYDHLGLVDPGEVPDGPPAKGAYYPGANDNASGVALVFELISLMTSDAADSHPARSVLFVNFAAEEVGLQGSGYLVSHLPVPADRVDGMINIDTVGQLTDNRLHVSGVGTAAEFAGLVAAADEGDLDLALARGGWSGSDHMSFNTREIPVIFIFGGAYPQYNRPSDDWDSLDYPALARVTAYTHRLADLVRRETGPLNWVMVAEKELRPDEDGQGDQNRQTWLGTLPDFTEDVKGYKLAGVFDGSPAARAGLEKGDVLLSLGGLPVEDLATFTRALRSFLPGDLVEIALTRHGTRLNYTVVLGDRADRE
jgi:hypothetical protein